jgi:hypothetical protein
MPERIRIVSPIACARIETAMDLDSISVTAPMSASESADLPESQFWNATTPRDASPVRKDAPRAAVTASSALLTPSHYEDVMTLRRRQEATRRAIAELVTSLMPRCLLRPLPTAHAASSASVWAPGRQDSPPARRIERGSALEGGQRHRALRPRPH